MVLADLVGKIIHCKVEDTLQDVKTTEEHKQHCLGWLFNGYLDDYIAYLRKKVDKTKTIDINDLMALIELFGYNCIANADLVKKNGYSFVHLIYGDHDTEQIGILNIYTDTIFLLLSQVEQIKLHAPDCYEFSGWFCKMYAKTIPAENYSDCDKQILERHGVLVEKGISNERTI